MNIILLGTSSMVPTKDRNHSAALLSYEKEKILIDCGEGTQRQLRKAKISAMKITKILITHWHGDHVLGLPGLLQTMGAGEYNKILEIYGPKGSKEKFEKMFDFFVHRSKRIKYKVMEVGDGKFFENKHYSLEALSLDHSTPTLAFSFIEKDKIKINMDYLRNKGLHSGPSIKNLQEGKDLIHEGKKIRVKDATTIVKGKKIVLVTDTAYCANAVKISKNADILFSEATFLNELKDKAKDYKHMTAKEAGTLAKKAKVSKLILIHFSQRYKNVKGHVDEAKTVFANTEAGKDFQEFNL